MICFDNVTYAYQNVVALRNVSLHIASSATTTLIGPSGSGKSTLLKLIAGLVWPQYGRVTIDSQAVTPQNATELRQRTGYMIQSGGLFPHLTARDNVMLAARYLECEPEWTNARLDHLKDVVRLSDSVLGRYPRELSGGQRQRVSLMRALMLNPDTLLLDEPLGALDPIVRYQLQEELSDLFSRLKKSVVLVTHDLAEAAFFADTIVLMRDGAIVQQGSLEDLSRRPADDFVLTFLRAQRPIISKHG